VDVTPKAIVVHFIEFCGAVVEERGEEGSSQERGSWGVAQEDKLFPRK